MITSFAPTCLPACLIVTCHNAISMLPYPTNFGQNYFLSEIEESVFSGDLGYDPRAGVGKATQRPRYPTPQEVQKKTVSDQRDGVTE